MKLSLKQKIVIFLLQGAGLFIVCPCTPTYASTEDIYDFKSKIISNYESAKKEISLIQDIWIGNELVPHVSGTSDTSDFTQFFEFLNSKAYGIGIRSSVKKKETESIKRFLQKIGNQFKRYRDIFEIYFKKEAGFTVTDYYDEIEINGNPGKATKIKFPPVFVKHGKDYMVMALRGSGKEFFGEEPTEIPDSAFFSSETLQNYLSEMVLGGLDLMHFINDIPDMENQMDAANLEAPKMQTNPVVAPNSETKIVYEIVYKDRQQAEINANKYKLKSKKIKKKSKLKKRKKRKNNRIKRWRKIWVYC